MIILKHLTVERFRLLRSLNLHFPQRGSILIQGPNEAGKSALIESIYFALYGEPLLAHRGKRSLDDLILYGAESASVTLTLSVGATELSITRTVERGKGQQAQLQVRRLGLPDDPPLTNLVDANARIISELGRMNGNTLRNASLIEQKGLTRLENVSGTEREATVRKLLGLEKLLELTEQFQVGPEDEQALKERSEHLHLAEVQARIPEVNLQLEQIEAALDTVSIRESLAHADQQEVEIAELEQTIEEIQQRRVDFRARMGRVQQLKRADGTLSTIISSYDDIEEARRLIPELEHDIAELERREREELPKLEKRVGELAELTRSFGTLQRMSNDLLTAVDAIKELEQEVKRYHEHKANFQAMNDQVAHARTRLETAQRSLSELEERRRSGRPQLEARLQRLHNLSESLARLYQLEDQYTRRLSGRELGEENQTQLKKVRQDLQQAEQIQARTEQEARQAQTRAEGIERTWRQLSLRRQIGEWQRLKGVSDGLAQAQIHLKHAHEQNYKLDQEVRAARTSAAQLNIFVVICVVGCIACIAALIFAPIDIAKIIAAVVLVVLAAAGFVAFRKYRQSAQKERELNMQFQEASSRVSAMVVSRENVAQGLGSPDALHQVENEIRSLGGTVPTSVEEAQHFLIGIQEQGDLGEAQMQLKARTDEVNAARNQAKRATDTVTSLRKEQARLEEQRKRERWDYVEDDLRDDQAAVERVQQEVTLLAGQENLPMPSINARLQTSPIASSPSFTSGSMLPVMADEDIVSMPDLESLVQSTIKATEGELATLDGKLDVVNDLTAQVKVHQEALAVLVQRQKVLEERSARYEANNPEQLVERAREQQTALRSALQSLQDSLRQRVKPLGVVFGQAAISHAENIARKQLEELNITLGNKVMLQERLLHYTRILKERQEALGGLYKQLAKFSNSLGSWIVPPNPFAEALVGLRHRCQQELEEANEPGILRDLENLQNQENAAKAKIALCHLEISNAQEAIAALLGQRDYQPPTAFGLDDITAVWHLVGDYQVEDRSPLEEERAQAQRELAEMEMQERELSQHLGTTGKLDLDEARVQMEQQERSYQIKKRGNQLVKAVDERLLRKMLPLTEYYMQQILPLLTGGRYHDVHLETEPEDGTLSGGSCQILVWDSAAGDYMPSSTLSGGAADQLSLALRLAFAIATLPRELGAAPGFLLLDEPLSSFDRGRAQALVDVITGDLLGQHFEQVVLVSHSSAFDPAMFPYHVYMDNGAVVESNLPVVPTFPTLNAEGATETLEAVVVGSSRKASVEG
jgi:DNA repair exonuclease SbcCD ATPase subunit